MVIAPDTVIKLLQNVPLDATYEHTIYFNNVHDQYAYFSTLVSHTFTNFTYQRHNPSVIRVPTNAEQLFNCNYLLYQNSAFGTRWFYAFITDVNYINNECTEITFELDVMQTWLGDYNFAETFVEREHTTDDTIGANIVPENIATGEYVFNDYQPVDTALNEFCVVIAIVDTESADVDGELYDGVYGGAELWVYDSTDVQTINRKIADYKRSPDSIIGMYMIPKALIVEVPDTHKLPYGMGGVPHEIKYPAIQSGDSINGYVPRNNKLYTYPFNFFHIDNANGNDLTLRYEFFNNLEPTLIYGGTVTQPVQVTLRPTNYKTAGNVTLNTEALSLQGYPICSWNIDAYQAWVAQNSVPLVLNTLQRGLEAGQGGYAQAITNSLRIATSILSESYKASIAADISKGQFNNGSANVAMGKQQFYYGRCSVTAQQAKIIDDYFDMFGYATRRLKVPNRNARPHWNYVKTVSCNIHGSIPAGDMDRICEIYDKGITFWRDGNEVGHYELDNSL